MAVIGAGPVGLGAIMTANLCGAGRVITVDMDDNRMNKALELGATDKVNAADPDSIEKIKALSPDGLGVDVAIEAVGVPQTFGDLHQDRAPLRQYCERGCAWQAGRAAD